MNLKVAASLLALTASALCFGQSFAPGPQLEPKKPISFDASGIDTTVDPCVDFYQYACGNWRKNNPIPGDQVRWGRFNELAERNSWLLYQELKAAADAPKTPLQKKYGDYFAACMNVDLANQLGDKPIQPLLKEIAAWNDKKKLATLVAQLDDRYGSGAYLFEFRSVPDQKDSSQQIGDLDQGGLGLPDRDYYLSED